MSGQLGLGRRGLCGAVLRGEPVGTGRGRGACPALPTFLLPCSPPFPSFCLVPAGPSNMPPLGRGPSYQSQPAWPCPAAPCSGTGLLGMELKGTILGEEVGSSSHLCHPAQQWSLNACHLTNL